MMSNYSKDMFQQHKAQLELIEKKYRSRSRTSPHATGTTSSDPAMGSLNTESSVESSG